jgi:hypothetical protein
LAAGVAWNEDLFDILIQLVQYYIGKDRAQSRPLWHPTVRRVTSPCFDIPRVEELFYESQEAVIVDFLCQGL